MKAEKRVVLRVEMTAVQMAVSKGEKRVAYLAVKRAVLKESC